MHFNEAIGTQKWGKQCQDTLFKHLQFVPDQATWSDPEFYVWK